MLHNSTHSLTKSLVTRWFIPFDVRNYWHGDKLLYTITGIVRIARYFKWLAVYMEWNSRHTQLVQQLAPSYKIARDRFRA